MITNTLPVQSSEKRNLSFVVEGIKEVLDHGNRYMKNRTHITGLTLEQCNQLAQEYFNRTDYALTLIVERNVISKEEHYILEVERRSQVVEHSNTRDGGRSHSG